MKKLFPTLLFLLFVSSMCFGQTPSPTATPKPVEPNDDVVRISTTLIQVDVTVTDQKGKTVTDLKPEDFEIFENNEKQKITNFSFVSLAPEVSPTPDASQKNTAKTSLPLPPTVLKPEQVRRTIALVVDDLTLSFHSTAHVRQALKKFVDEQMQEGDLVAIVRTGGGIGALQQFTSDRRQLYAAIEKIRWNMTNGKIAAFAPIEASALERAKAMGIEVTKDQLVDEKNRNQSFNDFQGSIFATGTLGALNYIIRGMKDLPGRKSVMLMSEGFKLFTKDEHGFMDGSRILESLRRLTDMANRASVVVYTMDARGLYPLSLDVSDNPSSLSFAEIEEKLSDRKNELFDTQAGLAYLAQQTGGLAVMNNNDLGGGIKKMLDDQKGYYLLGYAPDSDTFDPKTRRFNRLNVKVNRPGLKVRYRSGFFGVSDENAIPAKQTRAQQFTAALTSPFAAQGINLRLNTLFGHDVPTGTYMRSLLHVNAKDLRFTDEPDGSHKATFEVLAISYNENGIAIDQIYKNYTMTLKDEGYREILRDGFVYNFVFPVKKPGAYQLRVALRDSTSEQIGSANQFIEVPDLKKSRLTLSGIVLENMTVKQFQNLQSNTSSPESAAESRSTPQGDTSLRRFKRGTVLHYGLEIYNAKLDRSQKPQLSTQIRVFHEGKILFEDKQKPLDFASPLNPQKIATAGAISLGSEMQPGDYILQVIVTDNLASEKRRIASQFVQFEIIP